MNKLGIALQAFAMASISGGYVPSSYYRKQTTYDRDTRRDRLSVTNPKVAQSVSTFVQGGAASACAGVNQTITSTGTTLVTMNCTGTVNMSTWAPGFNGGGGAFAKSAISVTNGQVFLAENGGGNQQATFICDHSVSNCKTGVGGPANGPACSTPTGLSLGNLVCAAASTGGLYQGGLAANSIGSTKFNGGTGTSGFSGYSFAGGGAAGPDGAGKNGTSSGGGAGDNGLGGAGGTVPGVHNGVSNALGGGGAGCTTNPSGAAGGAPGGGGASCNGGAYTNGNGQLVIHGALSPEMEILTGGSGYGGGTISAA